MLGDVLVQAFTFSTEDDGSGGGEVDLIVNMSPAFVQAIDPVAGFLQSIQESD